MEIYSKLEELRIFLNSKPEVSMAFLFGSYAKGRQISESDADVAVYFKPEGKNIDWEEGKEYPGEDRLWVEIESVLGVDTDLVVLNRAPSSLANEILRAGIPVVIKDRALYWRFFSLVGAAAEDFRQIINDWWDIKQRSKSLTVEDKERLIRAVDFLETELSESAKFEDINQREYESDSDKRRNMERWVENIVNAAIDIAKIILASDKEPLPDTYAEIMRSLNKFKNFNQDNADKLADFTKLRNLLAHEYLDLRFAKIKKFLELAPSVYNELLSFAKIKIGN